jgi:hypothetical protein
MINMIKAIKFVQKKRVTMAPAGEEEQGGDGRSWVRGGMAGWDMVGSGSVKFGEV